MDTIKCTILTQDAALRSAISDLLVKIPDIDLVRGLNGCPPSDGLVRFFQTSPARVVFLDVREGAALAASGQMELHDPGLQFIALGEPPQPNVPWLGVHERLALPLDPVALKEALGRRVKVLEKLPQRSRKPTSFISFLPAKPGAGTTTLACGLADVLSAQHKVLLCDFDLSTGMVGFRYRLEMSGAVALRMLYIKVRPRTAPPACSVVNITALMRELIVRTNLMGALDAAVPEQRRLIGVIFDELKSLVAVPLQLPLPQDPRAAQFASLVANNSAGKMSVAKMLRRCGASRRTLERIFRMETAMSLGQWLRRQKLLHALRRLAGGESVDSVAHELGYNSASAFIAMFRRELGQTPKRYFETQKAS